MKRLKDLLMALEIYATENLEVSNLCIDSREVKAGSLFFAYPGVSADGRDYIEQAVEKGAAAIVYEAVGHTPLPDAVPSYAVTDLQYKVGLVAAAFYDHPSRELQVFGVTGTNGKTTVCSLLAQAFESLDLRSAIMGTIGIGELKALSKANQTTPNPIAIQAALRECVDADVTQVCMEVSSHALEQGRVAGVEFFCTLFTNLSHDHLDYHGSMQAYAAAKRRLFVEYPCQLSVINNADSAGAEYLDEAIADFVVAYGAGGDVVVDGVELDESGLSLFFEGNGVEFQVVTPLIGAINVPNLELVVATLLALSIPVEKIQSICAELRPAPGRMEVYAHEGKPRVVVDYAHTPDALEKALQSVRAHCRGQLWCVFGCGGDRDAAKRPLMGSAADKLADIVIITNDNPRSEDPAAIADEIVAGINGEHQIILDRGQAITHATAKADSEDWVLVAGKGHESTQEIGTQILDFSDRDYVAQIIGVAA